MISHRVIYRDDFPSLEYPFGGDLVEKVIVSKGRAWEAEREIRYVSLHVVRNSIEFDSRALRGVILGARFPKEHLPHVFAMLEERKRRGMREPILYQAQQKRTSYGVEIKRFKVE